MEPPSALASPVTFTVPPALAASPATGLISQSGRPYLPLTRTYFCPDFTGSHRTFLVAHLHRALLHHGVIGFAHGIADLASPRLLCREYRWRAQRHHYAIYWNSFFNGVRISFSFVHPLFIHLVESFIACRTCKERSSSSAQKTPAPESVREIIEVIIPPTISACNRGFRITSEADA